MKLSWKRRNPKSDVSVLETAVANVLKPVSPQAGYMLTLQNQLMNASLKSTAELETESSPYDNRSLILIGVASIFGITIAVLTGFRAVIGILGALGLLGQGYRQLISKQATPRLQSSV